MGLNFGVFSLLESSQCIKASTYNGECSVLTLGRFKNYFSEIQRDISDIKNVAEDNISLEKDSSNIDDKKKDE